MKRAIILTSVTFLLWTATSSAQLLMTKNGVISFHSHTVLEDIDAVNDNVMAAIDGTKKSIAFTLHMKQFVFPRKLMQTHFNENYVESDKFPKATFSGSYTEDVPFNRNGTYNVNVRGKLTIHGVTREVTIPATITVNGTNISGTSTFKCNPTDYNISIPFIVRNKIEKENTVKVKVQWTQKY
jgi:hypothetical protein